jgi:hypothetical protein
VVYVGLLLFALSAAALRLEAQPRPVPAARARPEFEAAVGAAVPHGVLGQHRKSGLFVRAGLAIGDARRIVSLRVHGEAALLSGRPTTGADPSERNDLRVLGLMGSVKLGPGPISLGPYLIAGGGLQRLAVAGDPRAVSWAPAVRAGIGLEARIRRLGFTLEIAPTYAFTSRGAEPDVWMVSYQPITVGITF